MNEKLINFPRFEKLPPLKATINQDKIADSARNLFSASTMTTTLSNANLVHPHIESFAGADCHPELKRIKKNAGTSQPVIADNQQLQPANLLSVKTEQEVTKISSFNNLTQTMKNFLINTKARIKLGEIKGKTLDVLFKEQFPSHRISYACANSFVNNYKSLVRNQQNNLSGTKTDEDTLEINSLRSLTQTMKDFLLKTKARIKLGEIKGKTLDVLFKEQFPSHRISYACANSFINNHKSQLKSQQDKLSGIKVEEDAIEINSFHSLTQTMKDFLLNTKARINLGEIKDKTLDVLFVEQFPSHRISIECARSFVNSYKSLVESQQAKLLGVKTEEGIIEINSFHNLTQAMKDFLLKTKARIKLGEIKGKALDVLFNEQFPNYRISIACARSFVNSYKFLVESQQAKLSGIKIEEGVIEINSFHNLTQAMKDFLVKAKASISFGEIKGKTIEVLFNEQFPSHRISYSCATSYITKYKSLVKIQQAKLSGIKLEEDLIEIKLFQELTQPMKDFLLNTKARINLGKIKGKTLPVLFSQQFTGYSISSACASNFISNYKFQLGKEQNKLLGIKTEHDATELS